MLKRVLAFYMLALLLSGCSKKEKKNPTSKSSRRIFAKQINTEVEIVLPGKSKKQPVKKWSKTEVLAFVEEQEAKLYDVPIPLHAHPLTHKYVVGTVLQDGLMLWYATELVTKEVARFYQHEMERFGWKLTGLCAASELLLLFEKPQRFCAVSIRPQGKKFQKGSQISIATGNKEVCSS